MLAEAVPRAACRVVLEVPAWMQPGVGEAPRGAAGGGLGAAGPPLAGAGVADAGALAAAFLQGLPADVRAAARHAQA